MLQNPVLSQIGVKLKIFVMHRSAQKPSRDTFIKTTQPSTWSLAFKGLFLPCLLACLLLGGPGLLQAGGDRLKYESKYYLKIGRMIEKGKIAKLHKLLQSDWTHYRNPRSKKRTPYTTAQRSLFFNDVLFWSFVYGNKDLAVFALEHSTRNDYTYMLDRTFAMKQWHMIPFGASLMEDKGKEWLKNKLYRNVFDHKPKIAEILIQAGANPNTIRDFYGEKECTPITFRTQKKEMMLLLIKLGGDPTLKNCKGQTLLEYFELFITGYYHSEMAIELRKILKLPRNLELEAKLPALRKKQLEWEKQNPPGPELGY